MPHGPRQGSNSSGGISRNTSQHRSLSPHRLTPQGPPPPSATRPHLRLLALDEHPCRPYLRADGASLTAHPLSPHHGFLNCRHPPLGPTAGLRERPTARRPPNAPGPPALSGQARRKRTTDDRGSSAPVPSRTTLVESQGLQQCTTVGATACVDVGVLPALLVCRICLLAFTHSIP